VSERLGKMGRTESAMLIRRVSHTLFRLILTAALVCLMGPVSLHARPDSPLAESEPAKRYTIQTGTFASYGQCLRQFMELARKLDPEIRGDLRIERLEKYYVVRISSHDQIEDAYKKLAVIRESVSDAFAMNESPATDAQTLYLYPDISATSDAYTLEAGRYPDLETARNRYHDLKSAFQKEAVPLLRLERQGEFFLVSLGPFDNFVAARKTQRMLRSLWGEGPALRERTPGEGTELLAADPPKDPEGGSAGEVEASPNPPAEPFETQDIVKPLESIDATMNSFLDEKEYGKAIEVIKQAIDRWPDNPDLYAWYGTVLMEMDRPDKALEHYQRAAELAPAVPEYQSNLGYSYLHIQRNSVRQSIHAFNRALTIDPENSDALEGLGTVYVSIGRKDLAVGIHEELKLLDTEAARRLQDLIRFGIDFGDEAK